VDKIEERSDDKSPWKSDRFVRCGQVDTLLLASAISGLIEVLLGSIIYRLQGVTRPSTCPKTLSVGREDIDLLSPLMRARVWLAQDESGRRGQGCERRARGAASEERRSLKYRHESPRRETILRIWD
jgi:hypothetical protein